MDELLSVADVARRLGVVPARVRQLADEGKLAVVRTASGVRIFKRAVVERLAKERESRRVEKLPA